MYEYTHGGGVYDKDGILDESILDFSASINPLGMPDEVLTAAHNSLARSNIYPDSYCRYLTSQIAEFEGVRKENIYCGGGASDILFRLVYAVKPKRVLVTAPSFADYERAGKAAGAEVIYHALKNETGFTIDDKIIDTIFAVSPDAIFICNPNNPTGTLINRDLTGRIAEACKSVNALLLMDECFMDFVYDAPNYTVKPLMHKYNNIVLLKAFTKTFAMPGLRLGYAICGEQRLIDSMRFHGADWPVSNIAAEAGAAAMKNADKFIMDSVYYLEREREWMSCKLEYLGLTVYPSAANFIFFHCTWDVDLYDELLRKNFMIRDCSNYNGLGHGYFRIAVLTRDKNKMLIKALREIKYSWQNR